jgi:dTDP-glucose pyrophosphorylase
VLAGGLGTRMRAADPDAPLTADQSQVADAGLKAMIPVHGRPFLDYILSSLADAGIREVALVVAPDHEAVRRYYVEQAPPKRVSVSFMIQPEPLGTAHALLTAEQWTNGDAFLALNGDNVYPARALADLASLDEPGLPAFERDDLVSSSNIPPERIQAFAVIEVDDRGYLTGIIEKPGAGVLPREGESGFVEKSAALSPPEGGSDERESVASAFRRKDHVLISMNCWRFDSRIFAACRDVLRSRRGEFELPEAVGLAVRRGVMFKALPARGPVLDLSRRADAADVARRLAGSVPRP